MKNLLKLLVLLIMLGTTITSCGDTASDPQPQPIVKTSIYPFIGDIIDYIVDNGIVDYDSYNQEIHDYNLITNKHKLIFTAVMVNNIGKIKKSQIIFGVDPGGNCVYLNDYSHTFKYVTPISCSDL